MFHMLAMKLSFSLSGLLLFSLMLMLTVLEKSIYVFFSLGKISSVSIEWSGVMDSISCMFLITVSLISFSVFNFSFSYMSGDINSTRFHVLLFMFVFSMLILIMSNNLMSLMIGWDGLGVTSYLLVIYYGSIKSYSAGMVTFLTNRVGDFLIMLSLMYVVGMGTMNIVFYNSIMSQSALFLGLLALSAFTKSAQIPFSAWLPAAMAAPTPVSSLVHSSTLVTAGVYLLIRHIGTALYHPFMLEVFFMGLATMSMASLAAMNEKDMKKMIALSTLSQLGIMVMSIGVSLSMMSFLHLVIHAFFKAMMFISTGNLIHVSGSYQAIQHTGAIMFTSPVNVSISMVASLSLMGTPFSAAYFSKEPIIEMTISTPMNTWLSALSVIGVLLTVMYSMRFVLITMSNNSSSSSDVWGSDNDFSLNKGMYCLLFPSFLSGSLMSSSLLSFPKFVYYSNFIKVYITLMLVTCFFLALLKEVLQAKKGEFSFFSMWNLNAFSSCMWNPMSFMVSGEKQVLLHTIINSKTTNLTNNSLHRLSSLESNYIFRLISVVPVMVLLSKFS